MDKEITGLNHTFYEISDLHTIFSMSYTDVINGFRDYGTGAEYTMLEAHAITLIERSPGITVTEISKAFGRSKSAISQLISRLEKKGLVIKTQKDGENQKLKGLYVTQKGQEFSQFHVEYDTRQVAHWMKILMSEFSTDELNTIYHYMAFVIKNKIARP